MQFPSLIPASFLERPNKFLGRVELDGRETICHVPNPGRMNELLYHGSKIYLTERSQIPRKTRYDLTLVDHEGTLVSIDSRLTNRIVEEAIMNNLLPEFRGSSLKKREPTYRDSRFDFHLSGFARDMLLEVKSCTLVQNSTALFPDAPTKRGTRHLKTLIEASNEFEVAILFIIQRNDSSRFKPNYITDPDFSNTLEKAFDRGVKVFAYDCNVTPSNIAINKRVPIQF